MYSGQKSHTETSSTQSAAIWEEQTAHRTRLYKKRNRCKNSTLSRKLDRGWPQCSRWESGGNTKKAAASPFSPETAVRKTGNANRPAVHWLLLCAWGPVWLVVLRGSARQKPAEWKIWKTHAAPSVPAVKSHQDSFSDSWPLMPRAP